MRNEHKVVNEKVKLVEEKRVRTVINDPLSGKPAEELVEDKITRLPAHDPLSGKSTEQPFHQSTSAAQDRKYDQKESVILTEEKTSEKTKEEKKESAMPLKAKTEQTETSSSAGRGRGIPVKPSSSSAGRGRGSNLPVEKGRDISGVMGRGVQRLKSFFNSKISSTEQKEQKLKEKLSGAQKRAKQKEAIRVAADAVKTLD
ncbi:MAG: hypothetical protein V4487_03555 [Chlamydiota bacterium]